MVRFICTVVGIFLNLFCCATHLAVLNEDRHVVNSSCSPSVVSAVLVHMRSFTGVLN
jgi:hypothetical protein